MTKPKKVRYIKRPNLLKMKAGHGGIPIERIQKAEKVITEYKADFTPDAFDNVVKIDKAINEARKEILIDNRPLKEIPEILRPVMILKSYGGMFQYRLISDIADICMQYIESLEEYNLETLDIIRAHEKTLHAIVKNEVRGDGGDEGYQLVLELHNACQRYFEKYNVK